VRRCFFHVMNSHKANEDRRSRLLLDVEHATRRAAAVAKELDVNTAGMGISCLSRDDEGTEMWSVLIGGT